MSFVGRLAFLHPTSFKFLLVLFPNKKFLFACFCFSLTALTHFLPHQALAVRCEDFLESWQRGGLDKAESPGIPEDLLNELNSETIGLKELFNIKDFLQDSLKKSSSSAGKANSLESGDAFYKAFSRYRKIYPLIQEINQQMGLVFGGETQQNPKAFLSQYLILKKRLLYDLNKDFKISPDSVNEKGALPNVDDPIAEPERIRAALFAIKLMEMLEEPALEVAGAYWAIKNAKELEGEKTDLSAASAVDKVNLLGSVHQAGIKYGWKEVPGNSYRARNKVAPSLSDQGLENKPILILKLKRETSPSELLLGQAFFEAFDLKEWRRKDEFHHIKGRTVARNAVADAEVYLDPAGVREIDFPILNGFFLDPVYSLNAAKEDFFNFSDSATKEFFKSVLPLQVFGKIEGPKENALANLGPLPKGMETGENPIQGRSSLAQRDSQQIKHKTGLEYQISGLNQNPVFLKLFKLRESAERKTNPQFEPLKKFIKNAVDATVSKGLSTNPHWPRFLIEFTESLKGQSAISAAEQMQAFMKKHFLYFSLSAKIDSSRLESLKRQYLDFLNQYQSEPLAMAHLRAVNCDGAAWLSALMLRDLLGHRVRIVIGYRAKPLYSSNENDFYSVGTADHLHSWIQVFEKEAWHDFDMTPPLPLEQSDSLVSHSSRQSETEVPGQMLLNEAIHNSLHLSKDLLPKADGAQPEESKLAFGAGEQRDQGLLAKKVAVQGALAPDKSEHLEQKEAAILRVKSRLASSGTSPGADGLVRLIEMEWLEQILFSFSATSKNEYSFASGAIGLEKVFKDLRNLLNDLEFLFTDNEKSLTAGFLLNKTMNRLVDLKYPGGPEVLNALVAERQNSIPVNREWVHFTFTLLKELEKRRELNLEEKVWLNKLQEVLDQRGQSRPEMAKTEALQVKEIEAELGQGILRDWVLKQYGPLVFLDPLSADYKRFVDDLNAGNLAPLLRAIKLKDFVQYSYLGLGTKPGKENTKPSAETEENWDELGITRNPFDYPRMIFSPRPGEHLFAPTFEGRQFAIGAEAPDSPQGRSVSDEIKWGGEKKLWLIYVDRSNSMGFNNNERIIAADALVLALLNQSFKPNGDSSNNKAKDEVIVCYFNNYIDGIDHIKTKEEAFKFIEEKLAKPTPTAGGTDLNYMVAHMISVLKRAYGQTGVRVEATQSSFLSKKITFDERMKRANFLLITDGDDRGVKTSFSLKNPVVREALNGSGALLKNLSFNVVQLSSAPVQDLKNFAFGVRFNKSQTNYFILTDQAQKSIRNLTNLKQAELLEQHLENLSGVRRLETDEANRVVLDNAFENLFLSPYEREQLLRLTRLHQKKAFDSAPVRHLEELKRLSMVSRSDGEMDEVLLVANRHLEQSEIIRRIVQKYLKLD